VIRVGLTGGIGAGKSTVAALLASYGAVVVDADALARAAVAPGTPGLASVVAEFGPGVLSADGSLDRTALAAVAFADPDRLAALNAIVHPEVARLSAEVIAGLPGAALVVYDVPLLVENDLQGAYDYVIVVDAPEDAQIARLTGQRQMTVEQARERIAAQASRERRRAVADVVIDNPGTHADGDRSALELQVRAAWDQITSTDLGYAGACWRGDATAPTLLVVRARDGRWTFPKGHREVVDAHPSDTVRRELREEAGVDAEVEGVRLAAYRNERRDGSVQQVRAHLARFLDTVGPGEPDREPRWCSPGEAAELLAEGRSREGRAELLAALDAALTRVAGG
jgi:dephospho-CoA kinase